jgi:hypothetical protein
MPHKAAADRADLSAFCEHLYVIDRFVTPRFRDTEHDQEIEVANGGIRLASRDDLPGNAGNAELSQRTEYRRFLRTECGADSKFD